MADNPDRALAPGSAHLLAVIEQRTRLINRVMGELTSRDTEAFFRRHPEFFRLVVSRYYPLTKELIGRYEDWWDWWDWEGLSRNEVLQWNETLIERYTNRWSWWNVSRNRVLPWSEALIVRYADPHKFRRRHKKSLAKNYGKALIDLAPQRGLEPRTR